MAAKALYHFKQYWCIFLSTYLIYSFLFLKIAKSIFYMLHAFLALEKLIEISGFSTIKWWAYQIQLKCVFDLIFCYKRYCTKLNDHFLTYNAAENKILIRLIKGCSTFQCLYLERNLSNSCKVSQKVTSAALLLIFRKQAKFVNFWETKSFQLQ